MKAGIYYGQRNVAVEDRPTPVCGPRDVLLKTVYASVCGTDAAVFQHGPGTGHRVTVGGEFGHEAVCRVEAVGPEVTEFQVGQRVYPYPLLVTGDTSRAGTMVLFPNTSWPPTPRRAWAFTVCRARSTTGPRR